MNNLFFRYAVKRLPEADEPVDSVGLVGPREERGMFGEAEIGMSHETLSNSRLVGAMDPLMILIAREEGAESWTFDEEDEHFSSLNAEAVKDFAIRVGSREEARKECVIEPSFCGGTREDGKRFLTVKEKMWLRKDHRLQETHVFKRSKFRCVPTVMEDLKA